MQIVASTDTFTKFYHPGVEVKPTTFPILAPFVPITFDPNEASDLRILEGRSGLEEGSVESARWMKPIARRTANQTSAHLILNIV